MKSSTSFISWVGTSSHRFYTVDHRVLEQGCPQEFVTPKPKNIFQDFLKWLCINLICEEKLRKTARTILGSQLIWLDTPKFYYIHLICNQPTITGYRHLYELGKKKIAKTSNELSGASLNLSTLEGWGRRTASLSPTRKLHR